MQNEDQWTFTNDPFPKIPAALLNSADIQAYQEACGLIRGQNFALAQLKPASYEIKFLGDVHWWDLKGPRRQQRIEGDKSFQVKKNSIVYVSPDAIFALPDFIAMRFNLRINLVHRGLLLGTGPLVDPGFRGRLLIPLHNLTSEPIEIGANDGLIWVEFTKISPLTNPDANRSSWSAKEYEFKKFPPSKRDLTPLDYFGGAGGGPFKSSLAELVTTATNAEKTIKRWGIFGGIAGVLGIAIAMGALLFSAWQFWMQSAGAIRDSNQWVQDSRQELAKKYAESKETTDALSTRLDALESKIASKSNTRELSGRTAEPAGKDTDSGANRSISAPPKLPK
jgi:deoxycytidine triphosphate deaminase